MTTAAHQGVCPTCLHDHGEPVTALASGSGDHAPAGWRVSLLDGGWVVCGYEQTALELAAARKGSTVQALYGPALLAEIAALRDYGKSAAKEALEYRARATEAERKLAEAVGLLRSVQDDFISDEMDHAIRTFLSKEAERG